MATCRGCGATLDPLGRCATCAAADAPAAAAAAREGLEFHTAVVLRSWAHRPGAAQALDDEHLLDYRYPEEVRSLLVALAVVLVTVGAALVWNPLVALGVLVLWGALAVSIWLLIAQHIARGAEITPTQFAHLYPMVAELRKRFAMPRTRVFIVQSPVLNAFAFGFKEPYVVVLHSALVDAMDPLELKSVIGHEMGHIKFGHTRLSVVLGGLDVDSLRLPFPLSAVAAVRRFIFLWWQRSQELTADRAGVVACGRPSKVISALVKLNVGPTMYQHVNIDDLAQQARDLRTGWWRIWGFISQLSASHPFMVNRIQAVVDFVGGPEPGHGLRLRDPDGLRPTGAAGTGSAPSPPPPPAPPPASLAVRQGAGVGRIYPLQGGEVTVGRGSGNTVQIEDVALSRRHFRIHWSPDAYVLDDLGSSNGTYVNGAAVQTTRLRSGDVIQVGNLVLEFRSSDVRF